MRVSYANKKPSIADYYPSPHQWEQIDPSNAGFDPRKLAESLVFAAETETDFPTDLRKKIPNGKRHPFDRQLGPIKDRSAPSGVILKGGYLLGQFGPVDSIEVTFSVTKSYISAAAGLAYDDGLINDLDDRVGSSISDGGFDSSQNIDITWRQLLQQTSEWEGELFGIPDWIDRGRQVNSASSMEAGTIGESASKNETLNALEPPGTFWEYNDVRVNRTALSLLRLFHTSLPEIISSRIMTPIGASQSWEWHGYDTSWVEEGGRNIQSVSGGGHWGGGIWINAFDHARFGLLYLRRGRWRNLQLLSQDWIGKTLTPCLINQDYGLLWWLNQNNTISDLASPQSFAARGAGGNIIFVVPERDLVIVLRWCGDSKIVIDRILNSQNN
ncbi:MAG: hypothetical protein DF168_01453 [Candidatus Moanabacter tarae]|uniref:Beta-lactamase-related domain-containing protein n=1 Tax=Candidatus Moanibacter tarae TaxID=2200854 RepID=A0A2Z4AME4_9BACT|nr:MAG: hypothetical protein DF168_01453 [Candidatus Moanabacter tarae]|tara:strand:- start:1480 stop:2634 length:1155 start_codon:yes stop_codon:yes gene_type:complete